nr:heme-copper oxidase subunit III [Auraticoccus cholistanensis]
MHPIARSRLSGIPGRPDTVAVGTIVWLASELLFFGGLFAAYFTTRSVTNAQAEQAGVEVSVWEHGAGLLNIEFAVLNTLVLVLSSVTCQLGVSAVEHGQSRVKRTGPLWDLRTWGLREWFFLTFLMGAFFIGGQVYEYAVLFSEGMTLSSDVYGSVFFLATGFHGLHVTGGLIAFLFLLGRTYLARTFTHEQATAAVAVSYYWHFVDVVWILLFGVIYFLQ